MNFIVFLNLFFCALMIFYASCVIVATLTATHHEPNKTPPPAEKEATKTNKAECTEWLKIGGRWHLVSVQEISFKPTNKKPAL
jgi:hypothetical protein